jgi:hypothetical protein
LLMENQRMATFSMEAPRFFYPVVKSRGLGAGPASKKGKRPGWR